AVAASRRGTNRNGRGTVSPAAAGTYRATGSVGHSQVILRIEIRCVSLVSGGSNSVRGSSATAPTCPYVPNACATALRGGRGNRVARTRLPGKGLGRSIR